MRFWDSSALLALAVREESSERMVRVLEEDPAVVTWWGTAIECASGLSRLEREGTLDRHGIAQALERLRLAGTGWAEVPATPPVREQAIRLVRTHPLRAADAMQLAAAIVASDFQPSALEFVTLDNRQAAAAEREGFRVLS